MWEDEDVNPEDPFLWEEEKLIPRDSPQGRLFMVLTVMKAAHVYWCPPGGHFGITVFNGRTCHMGCHEPQNGINLWGRQ